MFGYTPSPPVYLNTHTHTVTLGLTQTNTVQSRQHVDRKSSLVDTGFYQVLHTHTHTLVRKPTGVISKVCCVNLGSVNRRKGGVERLLTKGNSSRNPQWLKSRRRQPAASYTKHGEVAASLLLQMGGILLPPNRGIGVCVLCQWVLCCWVTPIQGQLKLREKLRMLF